MPKVKRVENLLDVGEHGKAMYSPSLMWFWAGIIFGRTILCSIFFVDFVLVLFANAAAKRPEVKSKRPIRDRSAFSASLG